MDALYEDFVKRLKTMLPHGWDITGTQLLAWSTDRWGGIIRQQIGKNDEWHEIEIRFSKITTSDRLLTAIMPIGRTVLEYIVDQDLICEMVAKHLEMTEKNALDYKEK